MAEAVGAGALRQQLQRRQHQLADDPAADPQPHPGTDPREPRPARRRRRGHRAGHRSGWAPTTTACSRGSSSARATSRASRAARAPTSTRRRSPTTSTPGSPTSATTSPRARSRSETTTARRTARIIVLGYPHGAPRARRGHLRRCCRCRDDDYDVRAPDHRGPQRGPDWPRPRTLDATYIDMYDVSEGHDICADEPWVAGAPIRADRRDGLAPLRRRVPSRCGADPGGSRVMTRRYRLLILGRSWSPPRHCPPATRNSHEGAAPRVIRAGRRLRRARRLLHRGTRHRQGRERLRLQQHARQLPPPGEGGARPGPDGPQLRRRRDRRPHRRAVRRRLQRGGPELPEAAAAAAAGHRRGHQGRDLPARCERLRPVRTDHPVRRPSCTRRAHRAPTPTPSSATTASTPGSTTCATTCSAASRRSRTAPRTPGSSCSATHGSPRTTAPATCCR